MGGDGSDCDNPTGGSRVSGNEGSGSDPDSDSEVEVTDAEDLDLEEAVFDKNAFEMLLMGNQQPGVFEEASFLYQRRPDPSLRTVQRKEKAAKQQDFGIRRDNCKKRSRLQTTSSSTQSSIAS